MSAHTWNRREVRPERKVSAAYTRSMDEEAVKMVKSPSLPEGLNETAAGRCFSCQFRQRTPTASPVSTSDETLSDSSSDRDEGCCVWMVLMGEAAVERLVDACRFAQDDCHDELCFLVCWPTARRRGKPRIHVAAA